MTIEEKAAAYDALLAENEKLRKRLSKVAPDRYISVRIEAWATIPISEMFPRPEDHDMVTDGDVCFALEQIDRDTEGGILQYASDNRDMFSVTWDASLVEED